MRKIKIMILNGKIVASATEMEKVCKRIEFHSGRFWCDEAPKFNPNRTYELSFSDGTGSGWDWCGEKGMFAYKIYAVNPIHGIKLI